MIESALNRTKNDLRILRQKLSAERNFKARAKWFDKGEKSNKYFLNLEKKYLKKINK